jgi:hypothetical protein
MKRYYYVEDINVSEYKVTRLNDNVTIGTMDSFEAIYWNQVNLENLVDTASITSSDAWEHHRDIEWTNAMVQKFAYLPKACNDLVQYLLDSGLYNHEQLRDMLCPDYRDKEYLSLDEVVMILQYGTDSDTRSYIESYITEEYSTTDLEDYVVEHLKYLEGSLNSCDRMLDFITEQGCLEAYVHTEYNEPDLVQYIMNGVYL